MMPLQQQLSDLSEEEAVGDVLCHHEARHKMM